MVIIDEHDIGKTKEMVLMDLLYESTGQRIPLDKVRFGKPRELDQRPEVTNDPNTFIPARIDPSYDSRYNSPKSGFMYRRRHILSYCETCVFTPLEPFQFPFMLSELLEQINAQIPYPLDMSDFVDKLYEDSESVAGGIRLQAHAESLLWCGSAMLQIDESRMHLPPIIDITVLDGFNVYSHE